MSQPETDPRLQSLVRVVDVTCQLAAEQNLDRLLGKIAQAACEALHCDRASLFLHDPRTEELYTRVATELEINEIRVPRHAGVVGWAAEHRQIVNIADPPQDPRWSNRFDLETGYRTQSILTAPLTSNNHRLIGVLQLLNKDGGPFTPFDEQLIQAFGAHAAVAVERAQLLADLKQQQMLTASLALARDIQASFQPQELPRLAGYEIAAWWQPAEGVGGDYYDTLPLRDGSCALVVADVSGHGVGPSLIMASARAMLRVLARTESDPARILTTLSETIGPDLQEGRFITFFLGTLDPQRHALHYANAGHAPAILYVRAEDRFRPLTNTGFPVGVAPEIPYTDGEDRRLAPGDVLLLATDGSFEQRNAADVALGMPRLQEVVRTHRDESAEQLVGRLRSCVQSFYNGAFPTDDVTLLVVKRT